jgi:predicted permease
MHALYFEHEPYRGLVRAVFQADLPDHLLSFIKTYICSKGPSPPYHKVVGFIVVAVVLVVVVVVVFVVHCSKHQDLHLQQRSV